MMSSIVCKQCNQLFSKPYQLYYGIYRWQHFDKTDDGSIQPKPFSEMPEPKKLPLLGTSLDYTKFRDFNPNFFHKFLQKRHKLLGPIYKENILPGLTNYTVFTSSPSDVEKYFRLNERLPLRPPFLIVEASRREVGLNIGVINLQGEEWYRVRKVYNEHLLTNKYVWNYTKAHLDISCDLVDFIRKNLDANNEVPDMQNCLYHWALECGAAFALDIRLGTFTNEVTELSQTLVDSSYNLFQSWNKLAFSPPWWKLIKTKDFKNACKYQAQQYEAIKEYARSRGSKSTFQEVASKSTLTPSEEDMLVPDILGAAVDTTSNAASFLLYCLAVNPDKQEILREEIKNLLSSGEKITGKALRRMKYLYAVNMEAQRLFPLVFSLAREASEDIVLSGYEVPKGTMMVFSSNMINCRDPKYFEDPDSFIPERWLKTGIKNKLVISGSFGMGSRKCPGRMLALQELSCLLISLLSRFKVEYHYKPFELMIRIVNAPTEAPRFTFLPLAN